MRCTSAQDSAVIGFAPSGIGIRCRCLRRNYGSAIGIAEQVGATRIRYAPFEHCQEQPSAGRDERSDVRRKPLSRFFYHV